jgi:hypothetical protein
MLWQLNPLHHHLVGEAFSVCRKAGLMTTESNASTLRQLAANTLIGFDSADGNHEKADLTGGYAVGWRNIDPGWGKAEQG